MGGQDAGVRRWEGLDVPGAGGLSGARRCPGVGAARPGRLVFLEMGRPRGRTTVLVGVRCGALWRC